MTGTAAKRPDAVLIAGPTASGKSALALEFAQALDHEVGGFMHVEHQFGVGVDMPAPTGDFVMQFGHAVLDRHPDSPGFARDKSGPTGTGRQAGCAHRARAFVLRRSAYSAPVTLMSGRWPPRLSKASWRQENTMIC